MKRLSLAALALVATGPSAFAETVMSSSAVAEATAAGPEMGAEVMALIAVILALSLFRTGDHPLK